MTATSSTPRSWGQEHFGTVQLRDKRRNRSLVDLADRILQHPGGTLPDKFNGDPKALNRCYDLMNSPHVTHAAVREPHRQRTFQLLRAHDGVVLNVFDQTVLDVSGQRSLYDDIGPVGNGHGRGYFCHHGLAIDPCDRSAFGLVSQILHVREAVPAKETRAHKRVRETRESRLWLKGVQGLPPAPAGKVWVDVCDAGSDTFEFLDYEDLLGRKYLIRAAQDRRIVVGHEAGGSQPLLFGHLRSLAAVGQRPLHVPARDGRPARDTEVAVAFAAVQLRVPRHPNGEYRQKPLAVWAIRVWEVNPPADVKEPVEWILLTNVPVTSTAAAWEKVDWYTCRWVVEEYHKGMKTGCAIEEPQFETVAAMQPMIALLSVVAVALLNLRDLSRRAQTKDLPAARVVRAEHVAVLSGWRYQERRELTVAEFTLALARLGGHLNRKGDHPPGWLVLWRGWTKLHLLVEGARAAARVRSQGPKTRHNRSP
jgi:hypothetical protein